MSQPGDVWSYRASFPSGFPSLYSWFNPDLKNDQFVNIGAKEVSNISILNSLSWKEQICILNPDISTI